MPRFIARCRHYYYEAAELLCFSPLPLSRQAIRRFRHAAMMMLVRTGHVAAAAFIRLRAFITLMP